MKTYIAATDFSEEAENALEYAGALAQKTGAKVILFNSFSLPVHTANALLPADAIFKMEEDNRLLLLKRAQELGEKYSIETDIKSGLFLLIEEGLETLFRETAADLVVMGMAAKSIEQDIFGNTTTSVILKLKYPVLAVPKSAVFGTMDPILFACEKLQKIELSVREKIKEFATLLNAGVEVFHVQTNSEQSERIAEAAVAEVPEFSGIDCSYRNYKSDNVIKTIEEEIKNVDAKLLIMIPQQYGFWESMIHRSKTRMMASGLFIPLLSFPQ